MNIYKCFQIARIFETKVLLAPNMRRILLFCNLLIIKVLCSFCRNTMKNHGGKHCDLRQIVS